VNDGGHRPDADWGARLREAGVAAQLARALGRYLALLERWGSAVDLLSAAGESNVLIRHVAESLAALPWVGEAGTLLDIGSGSGFPAIPVLLARPAVRGVLLEPRERRWAFLREVIRELELNAEAVRERAAEHPRGGYAVVTVRGLAMDAWLPYAPRLAAGDGTVLWWTSRAKADALTRKVRQERVLTFPLPDSGRGCLAVWRRCST
jgi:16S rRNA (guanine(527)-N(7))-methyltransferase RsmG